MGVPIRKHALSQTGTHLRNCSMSKRLADLKTSGSSNSTDRGPFQSPCSTPKSSPMVKNQSAEAAPAHNNRVNALKTDSGGKAPFQSPCPSPKSVPNSKGPPSPMSMQGMQSALNETDEVSLLQATTI